MCCCKLLQRLQTMPAAAELRQLLQRLQMLQQMQRLQLLQPEQHHTSCGRAVVRQQLCHLATAVLQPVGRGCAAALQQLCSGRAYAATLPLCCRRCAAALHMFCSRFATAPPQLVQLLRRSATTALQQHGADSSAAAPRLQRTAANAVAQLPPNACNASSVNARGRICSDTAAARTMNHAS